MADNPFQSAYDAPSGPIRDQDVLPSRESLLAAILATTDIAGLPSAAAKAAGVDTSGYQALQEANPKARTLGELLQLLIPMGGAAVGAGAGVIARNAGKAAREAELASFAKKAEAATKSVGDLGVARLDSPQGLQAKAGVDAVFSQHGGRAFTPGQFDSLLDPDAMGLPMSRAGGSALSDVPTAFSHELSFAKVEPAGRTATVGLPAAGAATFGVGASDPQWGPGNHMLNEDTRSNLMTAGLTMALGGPAYAITKGMGRKAINGTMAPDVAQASIGIDAARDTLLMKLPETLAARRLDNATGEAQRAISDTKLGGEKALAEALAKVNRIKGQSEITVANTAAETSRLKSLSDKALAEAAANGDFAKLQMATQQQIDTLAHRGLLSRAEASTLSSVRTGIESRKLGLKAQDFETGARAKIASKEAAASRAVADKALADAETTTASNLASRAAAREQRRTERANALAETRTERLERLKSERATADLARQRNDGLAKAQEASKKYREANKVAADHPEIQAWAARAADRGFKPNVHTGEFNEQFGEALGTPLKGRHVRDLVTKAGAKANNERVAELADTLVTMMSEPRVSRTTSDVRAITKNLAQLYDIPLTKARQLYEDAMTAAKKR